MGYLAAMIVGVLLGWLVTWILQNRLDDDMRDELAKLEREMAETKRELENARAGVAAVGASSDKSLTAGVGAAAVEDAYAVAEQVIDETPEVAVRSVEVDDLLEVVEEPEESPETEKKSPITTAPDDDGGEGADSDASLELANGESGNATTADVNDILQATAVESAREADLTVIKGIGPKFAATLRAGGVANYADLGAATPEQLHEIVQPAAWQQVDYEGWIAQAQALARQSQRLQIGDDLTKIEGVGPSYATKLRAAGIITFEALSRSEEDVLAKTIDAPVWRRVDYQSWIEQAKLAAAGDADGLKEYQDQLNRRDVENIGLIKGIGKTTLAAFEEAGIKSVADLAASTPEQLSEILANAGVRRGNVEAWIEEAQVRAAGKRVSRGGQRTTPVPSGGNLVLCPQDLGLIDGIGETYEQRLYDAGIGTFWEVSMLSTDVLTSILQVKSFQAVDIDAMQASARALVEETNSDGRVWDGTEPDNFEILDGIGEVFERRLYEAGVCTFAQLSQLSEERLQEICQAPPNFAGNFRRWLEQAREQVS